MKILFIAACIPIFAVSANIGTKGFRSYKNYYFVETGTLGGEAVIRALQDGFSEAHSVELDPNNFSYVKQRFASYKNVHVYHGNSAEILWSVIKPLDKPITFWLDAHRGPGQYLYDGKNSPIMAELEQIKQHPIKTHTILIDDMSGCGQIPFDFITLEQIKAKIREINPSYVFRLIEGGNDDEAENNILVAIPG